jgi:hypothetical protein
MRSTIRSAGCPTSSSATTPRRSPPSCRCRPAVVAAGNTRSTECGPFRSADDFESDQEPPRYFCNLAVWIDHPTIEENVQYDVEVTYPGAATERTAKVFTFCSSNGKDASCEH